MGRGTVAGPSGEPEPPSWISGNAATTMASAATAAART